MIGYKKSLRLIAFAISLSLSSIEATAEYELTTKLTIDAAESGNPIAQNRLAVMYGAGIRIEKNKELSLKWHIEAANNGNADSQYFLFGAYFWGDGVNVDKNKASLWLKKAAAQNHLMAMIFLAEDYEATGIQANYKLADELYLKAAEQGNEKALYKVAMMHFLGNGFQKNDQEALKYALLSAEKEYAPAQELVGSIYKDGINVEHNFPKSAFWFEKAAIKGMPMSQTIFGIYLLDGKLVPQDKVYGYVSIHLGIQRDVRNDFPGLKEQAFSYLERSEQTKANKVINACSSAKKVTYKDCLKIYNQGAW